MTKSNGITSLKQAAKLLNQHAPDGEKLAYINKKEAELLRSHGGSGIQTLQGVPSYAEIFGFTVPGTKGKDWGTVGGDVWNWATGRYRDEDPVYSDSKLIQPRQSGVGNLFQDAISVYAFLRAKKDQEGLNEAEMSEFNRLNAQLTASQEQFTEYTGGGEQLKAPTNVPQTIEDVSVFKETTGRPDMITTGQAQGGRIGYGHGGEYEQALADAWKTYKDQDGTLSLEEFAEKFMQGTTSHAQGGRIGAFNGGIQGLMPQQGFMPQPGLDPRMGYANAGEVENFNWGGPDMIEWATAREKGMDADPLFASRIMKLEGEHEQDVAEHEGAALFDKAWDLVNRGVAENINHALQMLRGEIDETIDETMFAHGGRIGAQGGGIMPLLNLGGMEKDYRQDGGFVPIGRKEKADDVPARLSKNEFVFTADAVKAAGGGDIDQGAQRMYNVMKNLEAGGEISEQSQGQA